MKDVPPNAEPVVFATALEALFQQVGRKLNAQAKKRLLEIGIDLDKPFLTAYAVEQWVAALRIAAECVYPGIAEPQADFQLGRDFIAGMGNIPMGRALRAYSVAVGRQRTLQRLTNSFRSFDNFIEAHVVEGAEGLVIETRVAEALLPSFEERPCISSEFLRGIFHGMLESGGRKNVYVELIAEDPKLQLAHFRLQFDE